MKNAIALGLFILASNLALAKPQIDNVVAQLQKTYDDTTDFSLNFKQRYTNPVLKRTDESQGTVRFKKPGLLRWDYEKPSKKAFIIDGKALWIHQIEDNLAFVDRCFKEDGLTASVAFLWGKGRIKEQFSVAWSDKIIGEKSDHHLALTPKKKNSFFKKLILVVDAKTFRVKQSVVVDLQDNQNQFIYSNMKFNSGLTKGVFLFKPAQNLIVQPIPGSCNAK